MIYLFTLKLIDYCRDNVLTIIEEVFEVDFPQYVHLGTASDKQTELTDSF